jgi:hypothetical protein
MFIKPSLGVSNWPVIYFINYTPSNAIKFSGTIHHRAINYRGKVMWDEAPLSMNQKSLVPPVAPVLGAKWRVCISAGSTCGDGGSPC